MENGFDVALMREMMARQSADANRIVMLCDALEKTARELEAMKKEKALALKVAESPK